jgi:hypothetical protein
MAITGQIVLTALGLQFLADWRGWDRVAWAVFSLVFAFNGWCAWKAPKHGVLLDERLWNALTPEERADLERYNRRIEP